MWLKAHDVLKTGGREIIDLDACGFLQAISYCSKLGCSIMSTSPATMRIELGLRVANDDPFHPIEIHRSAACQTAGRFFARHIFWCCAK
jgi:hypothetical protein